MSITVKTSGGGIKGVAADLARVKRSQVLIGIPSDRNSRLTKEQAALRIGSRMVELKIGDEIHYIHEKVTAAKIRREIKAFNADKAEGQTINDAELLFIHTNGSELRHLPARPVLEPAIAANSELIAPVMGAAAKDLLNGDAAGAENELNRAGVVASNAAKRWFTDSRNGWAPNAPETIKRKKSDKPLIDTGQLRKALTYIVRIGQ